MIMKLHVIDTGFFKLDGGAMFGVVPKVLWSKQQIPDENNLVNWAMRCLLIEKGEKKILIDTGMGDKQDEKFFKHYYPSGEDTLLSSIAKAGFKAEDITDVILTHLHFDHCGGAVSKDENGKLFPTFPNAKYWSEKNHWKWAVNPNPRERASFLKENFVPLEEAGVLHFVDESTEIIPEISFALAHGHTESMLIPHISYNGKTIVYMADLLPSPSHVPLAWVMGYDVRPLDTLREKEVFFKEAVAQNYILFFEHDEKTECGTIKQTEKGFQIDRVGSLRDFL
jgi:glyoxylase-like metal-dependent hydrolase (beta-lactamase superfamily II)